MAKGKPVYSVVSVPPVSEKDIARLFVQPGVPDALIDAVQREIRANEAYKDDTLSIFHVARTGAALEEVRKELFDILNGVPVLVYAVTVEVADGTGEHLPVVVYMSSEGEEAVHTTETDKVFERAAAAFDEFRDGVTVLRDTMTMRKFYSYGE